jgi:hypothetical protein
VGEECTSQQKAQDETKEVQQQHPHHKVLTLCDPKPTLAKIFFSHPSKVQLFTFFATPPIKMKLKDCKLVGTKLPIANHLDQSL